MMHHLFKEPQDFVEHYDADEELKHHLGLDLSRGNDYTAINRVEIKRTYSCSFLDVSIGLIIGVIVGLLI